MNTKAQHDPKSSAMPFFQKLALMMTSGFESLVAQFALEDSAALHGS